MTTTMKRLARAICKANPYAGALSLTKKEGIGVRADRLIEAGYIREPGWNGWGSSWALAVIVCERNGQCEPPFDYWDDSSIDQMCAVTLKGLGHIEWHNSAIAIAYK